jgi:DNA-binding NarL/FixJ family response regulator
MKASYPTLICSWFSVSEVLYKNGEVGSLNEDGQEIRVELAKRALRSLKILVVDDFEDFRRFVCAALRQRTDFQIMEASDGLEAVQKAEGLQPDLILLDIGLPELNGIEVARRVRRLVPAAKILFVSQESSADVVGETLLLGAQGYVHKPRAASDLLPAIDAVLEGKRFVSRCLEFSEKTEAQAPHRHEILFCSDDSAIIVGLARFIAAALNAGDAAMVLVTESHRNDLADGLRVRGVDVAAAIRRGTYVSLDAAVAPDPVQLLEAVWGLREAAAKAGKQRPRVAVCGERAGRLWAKGKTNEAIQLEQFCDGLAKTYEVDILCVYPSPEGHEEHPKFKSICEEHSAISFR